ncbi:MAG: carboxypeptidase-like regulatory domain-containing protein, partial [Planctomycetota bacterium]|nr:carboxypeptidase-like regulatory domain-containing protein [Planctomycetota bacterium]
GGLAVQTGADGGYRIQGLETGSVDLEFKASGFVDQVKARVKVLVGQRNVNQNVVLEAAGMVAGRVIDLSGQPIPGASISVSDFSDGLQQRRAVSDGNGIFRVQNIASKDTVGIEVTHEEYGSYEAEEVAVGTTDLEVTLSALGRVIGLVLDPDGQPAISFSVHPQPVGDSATSARSRRKVKSKTFNTTDGAFDYGGIPDGVYDVHVRVPLYSTVTRAEVRVVSGEVVDLGEIILEEGGQVTGHVLAAATRSPVAGARVRIVQGLSRFKDRKSSTAAAVQVTGTDGSFAFTGLRDGTLSLEVTHQDFVRKRVSNVDTQVATKSRDLLIELEQGGEISGAVVDANGRGQVGMQVYLMSKGGSSRNNRSTPTDAQGTFSFKGISPGTYTIKAHRFSADGGPPRMSEDEVQLRAGDHLELNLVVE